jgi:hypothetical protein
LAAPAIELLTVVLAIAFARWIVMPTASATTIAISSAVMSPNSFQTSGNGRARRSPFRRGISPYRVRWRDGVERFAVTQ